MYKYGHIYSPQFAHTHPQSKNGFYMMRNAFNTIAYAAKTLKTRRSFSKINAI